MRTAPLLSALLLGSGCSADVVKAIVPHVGDDSGAGDSVGDSAPVDDSAADDSAGDTGEEATIEASFNVIYQESSFGGTIGLCRVQFAFYAPEEDDGSEDSSGAVIEMPTEAGECVYTAFDPEEEVATGSLEVRGTLSAGATLTLEDASPIVLPLTEDEDGTLTYSLADCTRETFPFGRSFDVSAPGAEGGIPAFTLTQPVAVGPTLVRILPDDSEIEGGVLTHSVSTSMDWAWSYGGPVPETAEGPIVAEETFVLRHRTRADNFTFEALACMPDTAGELHIPAEAMAMLSPDPDDDSWYTSAQVDAYWEGAEVEAPWGELVSVRSIVTFGGMMALVE